MLDPCRHEILVVDDDAAVRDSIVLLLKASGYNVSAAVDGFDALLQLKKSASRSCDLRPEYAADVRL